jgi:hypothetical protein
MLFYRMKASDSTNSLTELTGQDECFICLMKENDQGEPLVSSKLLRTCGCKFFVHPACWNVWIKDKSDYDCPICRKQSVLRINIPPNPIFYVEDYHRHSRRPSRRPCVAPIAICFVIVFGIAIVLALVYSK